MKLTKGLYIMTIGIVGVLAMALLFAGPLVKTSYAACTIPASGSVTAPCVGTVPKNQADPALAGCQNKNTAADCGIITKYLQPIILFLGGLFAVAATAAIVVGGIQYAASADDPGKIAAAKQRIINAILGLLAFMFLWAFLEYIIPGGPF